MRIQRYLLFELLTAFALVALIVTSLVFAVLLLKFLQDLSQVSLLSVLRATPYLIPLAFPITLPLSFLIACLLTLGRFTEDNEFLALQMGGVHPWHAAAPAVVVSAALALFTVQLNTDVIPFATLAKKEVARGEIRELIHAVDNPDLSELRLGDFQMSWQGRDERGLTGVTLSWTQRELQPSGTIVAVRRDSRAGHVRIDVARLDQDLLVLDMDEFQMVHREGGDTTFLNEARRQVAITLDQLADEDPSKKDKGTDELSSSQIEYRIRRLRESSAGQPTPEQRLLLRKFETELHKRVGLGLAPLAFGLVGAGLGLSGGKGARGGRMTAYITAILIALPVYYPLHLAGKQLAMDGRLPPVLALNLPNLLLAAFGVWRLGRVFR